MNSDLRNRQTEAAECGLASLAMAASLCGKRVDLAWLRQNYPTSGRGATLKELAEIASAIGLSARPVACDVSELPLLKRPTILHWEMNHFVVLDRMTRKGARLFDPALGFVVRTEKELRQKFTGVAMELSPTAAFTPRVEPSPLNLFSLLHWSPQLAAGLCQILLLSILLQAYVVASPFYLQLAIDETALKGDTDLLRVLAIGFAAFVVFNAIAEVLRSVVGQQLAALLNWDMSQRLFRHLIRLPLPWFQRRRQADVFSRFQALEPVRALIANGLVSVLLDGVLGLVTAAVMVAFEPRLAAITLVGVGLAIAIRLASLPLVRRLSSDEWQTSIAEQGKRIETLRAVQTIKVMSGETRREAEWANKLAESIKAAQRSGTAKAVVKTAQQLSEGLVTILVVYFGVIAILDSKLSIGAFYAFLSYRTQFSSRATAFFDQVVAWRMLDIYAFRLSDVVLTHQEEGVDSIRPMARPITGAIELRNVAFRYGPREPAVFSAVSLSIPAGQHVAIVGASGVGKSTLAKVICGLYQPTDGEVLIDGVPIGAWGMKAVRSSFGVVLQDEELIPGSIAENVAFFDEAMDLPRVWACLEMACLDAEVRAMPMREHTFVGDLGSALSGGQRQRVLLARALYRRAKVLILDEATSQLDLAREAAVSATIAKLGITRIVIAHRPQTIAAADRVIQLTPLGAKELPPIKRAPEAENPTNASYPQIQPQNS